MNIAPYPKVGVPRLDQRWRCVFAGARSRAVSEHEALEAYASAPFDRVLIYANWQHTVAGEVTLASGEPKPHPRELCATLELQSLVLFPPDFTWCAWAGHEDWDSIKFAFAGDF